MKRAYLAKAKSWGLGESSTGKPQISVEFDILTDGADLQSIVWRSYFTEDTWQRTVESLRHCGWEGSDVSSVTGLDANEVELVIEDEEYNGKTFPKVRWVNKPGGLAIKAPLTGDKLKAFSAVMQERIKSMGPAPKSRPRAAQPQADVLSYGAPPLTDDDIPF